MVPLLRWPSYSTNESELKARQTVERERSKLPVEEGYCPNCGRTESEVTNIKERAPPFTFRRRYSRGTGAKEERTSTVRVRTDIRVPPIFLSLQIVITPLLLYIFGRRDLD